MYSLNGGYSPGYLPMPESQDSFLDTWTTQQAISEASRRLTRTSVQHTGSAMRISKPNSANNSPRASAGPSRRRITVNDNTPYRRPEQLSIPRQANKSSRPLSWHPSSQFNPTQTSMPLQQQQYYALSTTNMYPDQSDMCMGYPQLSPMMGSYSSNTSPTSAFSPLPVEYPGAVPQYLYSNAWDASHKDQTYYPVSTGSQSYNEPLPSLTHTSNGETPAAQSTEWQSYMHGMSHTTPPTPDSMLYPQQPQPAVSECSERCNDEPEDEGEILVGMGLYDTPDKYDEDPQLNNYRSTATSLFGSSYRSMEPTGKGLKLEETWEPPKSDDEEEEDDDDDDDSESSA